MNSDTAFARIGDWTRHPAMAHDCAARYHTAIYSSRPQFSDATRREALSELKALRWAIVRETVTRRCARVLEFLFVRGVDQASQGGPYGATPPMARVARRG